MRESPHENSTNALRPSSDDRARTALYVGTLAARCVPTETIYPASHMSVHPFVDAISSALAGVVPEEPVEVDGDWSSSKRRTYKEESQLGSGEGPYVEVVDHRWHGVIRGTKPLVGIGFLITPRALWWAKSPPRQETLPVDISLTTWAKSPEDGATFTGSVGQSFLPGVPVAFNGDLAGCALGSLRSATGQAHVVARLEGATFAVITLSADTIKVARNRLWHLRAEFASRIPEAPRGILTRGRTGSWSAG